MTAPVLDAYRKAQRHLARRDPVLKRLIARVGPCTLQPTGGGLRILVRAIVSQLISTKAANSISTRLESAAGPAGLTAEALVALGEERIRGAGLSGAKARAILGLAERVSTGELELDGLTDRPDDEVTRELVALRGIGVWTAEMYLIFALGRMDVLPVGDLGLRAGVRDCYELDEMEKPSALRQRAEVWRPYRSVATWYFWRSRGFVPQSAVPVEAAKRKKTARG